MLKPHCNSSSSHIRGLIGAVHKAAVSQWRTNCKLTSNGFDYTTVIKANCLKRFLP